MGTPRGGAAGSRLGCQDVQLELADLDAMDVDDLGEVLKDVEATWNGGLSELSNVILSPSSDTQVGAEAPEVEALSSGWHMES